VAGDGRLHLEQRLLGHDCDPTATERGGGRHRAVARHSRRDRAHLRGALGLRADATTVLVSFGGFGLDTDGIASLRDLADCDILMADSSVVSGATRSASGRTVARDGNLQAEAREARYAAAERLRSERGLDWIASTQSRLGHWGANEGRYPTAQTALGGSST